MAEISKQALKVQNNQSFPDNNSGEITPSDLRTFNVDVIDSTVNQIVYTTDSSSWNSKIAGLEAFTGSQQPSFNALNAFTASQNSINTGYNAATHSLNVSVANLNSEVLGIQIWTASVNEISFNSQIPNYATRWNFGGFISASFVENVNGRIADITVLQDSTKLDTASFNAYTASINSYTSSNDAKWTSLSPFTASITASVQQLLNLSSSLSGGYATQGELDAVSSSLVNTINTKLDSASFNLISSSFATTGSNVFTGDQTIVGDQTLVDSEGNSVTLSDASGSLMLVAKGYNSSSAHIVASGSSCVNLIFKNNNSTATTEISGSNNIFPNPNAPTAGFKRLVGDNNLMLTQLSVPQISSSMEFPVNINGNILSHPLSNAMTIRGPVSSSAYNIRGNILMHGLLNMGSSAASNFEKAQNGLLMFGNSVFGGNIVQIANKTVLTTAPVITNNLLFGAIITLNHNSSSITYTSNIQNGGLVVNNNYSPAVGTFPVAQSAKVGINTVYGVGHSVTLDGTNVSTSQTKQFYANILAGLFLSASVPTGDSCNILGVGMIGNSLTVTGSSTVVGASAVYSPDNTQGSLFVGRFNSTDGDKAKTAETVFAVGTGTSSNRKTGFLIDSGSNTFVEGSLTVTGSTSLSGSITITGSAFGNVVDLNVVSNTASIDLSAANYFTLLLPPSSTTNLNLTNVQPGVTATLVITTDTNSTASFSSNVKQPSGSLYVPSVSGSTDILSFTAVTANTVYVVPAYTFV